MKTEITELQKLSACIREGAKKRAQAFGDYIREVVTEGQEWGPYEQRTCALGAAYEAITGELPQSDWIDRNKTARTLSKATGIWTVTVPYPESILPGAGTTIPDLVIALNDNYKWSREQIADYLESLGY